MALTLEAIISSPKCFGLTTATPCQRALWRIIDGLPIDDLLATHAGLEEILKATCGPNEGFSKLPGLQPREIYITCGIRTAKSMTCAGIALKAALTVDLSGLQPWEEACVSVVSLTLKKAKIILRHLVGPLKARANLRPLLAREPTSSTVWIRRPQDGRIVRIEIAAGANAGGSLVGDWSAGAIFDEFTRMDGSDDGSAINFDDMRKAVLGRLLPGAQLVGVGSPWAPRGPAYEIVQSYWGNPTEQLVVLRPPALAMNPVYWTAERIAKLRASPKGEWVYRTDFLGEFADPESSFFSAAELIAVTRKLPFDLPKDENAQYFATMDPAKRRNAFTLLVGARLYNEDGSIKVIVCVARQWLPQPGKPLVFENVLREIKAVCEPFGVSEVYTDQWKHAELEFLGRQIGLTVTDYELKPGESAQMYDSLRIRVLGGAIELHPEVALRGDLLAVRKLVHRNTITMDLPVTSDGRHCDYAPAMVLLNEICSRATDWMHAMQKLADGGGRLM